MRGCGCAPAACIPIICTVERIGSHSRQKGGVMRLYLKLAAFVAAFVAIERGIDNGFGGFAAEWFLDARAAWAMTCGTDADREAVVAVYYDTLARQNGIDNRQAWPDNATAGWATALAAA